jgi:antitoxin Phd
MKTYSLTDLGNKSGEIAAAANIEPVAITNRGIRKYVLIQAEQYDRLSQSPMKRRVVNMDDLSDEDREFYIEALTATLAKLEDEE